MTSFRLLSTIFTLYALSKFGMIKLTFDSAFFFPLASMAKARLVAELTLAFRPGFDPGLPWSGRVADARV